MYKLIIGLGVFMVWAVWSRNYYVCEILKQCEPPQTEIDSAYLKNIPHNLDLMAGQDTLLSNYPQFYFDYCSHGYSYIDGNEKFLSQLASFLQENPTTNLVITGAYLKKEKEVIDKGHFYNNLGLARGYAVADKLVEEYQISKTRIKVLSRVATDEPIEEPLRFEIEGYVSPLAVLNQADTAFLQQVQSSIKDITYNDKSAKFEYDSEKFAPSGSFDIYIDSLKSYFETNPNDYLVIIGHTDSKGSASYNQKLGEDRALSVKKYLKNKGLDIVIKTQSKGEESPIVEDQNNDGSYNTDAMEQNRRVNILIKTVE